MKHLFKITILLSLLVFVSCQSPTNENSGVASNNQAMQEADSSSQDAIITPQVKPKSDNSKAETKVEKKTTRANQKKSENSGKYNLRKYDNVTQFYSRIAGPATLICMENNVPPASILAIAGLESGWNQGYIGRITGNILSLGTRGGDTELPALYLPRLKETNKILFDSLVIANYQPDELVWENRPPCLKKDYRPEPWAGTTQRLAYFKNHPEEKARAHVENLNDFVTVFISRSSRIKAYRDARHLMDSLVAINGKDILLQEETAIMFVNEIGGKPNSFNYRATWPVKVTTIIKNAGLADLTTEMFNSDKDFYEVW
jgi:hypothetical protein